jgi:S1-C subfamily serine protease
MTSRHTIRQSTLIVIVGVIMASLLVALEIKLFTPDPRLERAMDAVVVIETDTGIGTGFFISNDGCVMTAAHVVIDSTTQESETGLVILERGTHDEIPARMISFNTYLDAAIICADTKPAAILKIIDTETLKQGEPIYAIGHPMERKWNVTQGIVSRFAYKNHYIEDVPVKRWVLYFSAFISWGNSGGPIIDKNGNVVGMVIEWDGLEIGVPNNTNIAIPGTDLIRFIRETNGKY